MRLHLALTLSASTLVFAACGGGGGSTLPTSPGGNGGGTQSVQTQSESAINAANALGTPMKNFTSYNNAISIQSTGIKAQSIALGTCQNGREFFAPDKSNDPNSTEVQYFYDPGCTELARDAVRIYNETSSSTETANRTVKIYALGNGTPSAVRTDAVNILNATFDKYGYAIAADGFAHSAVDTLDIAGSKTIDSDHEIVMLPANANVNSFCSDSAGFNATGIASLNETFGWQGAVLSGGSRTINSDGSVTWSATHAGSTFKGAIGSLSIATGTQNTNCPITTPMFTLSGGSVNGAYSLPISATYQAGLLSTLTITNGTLANGNTLNVTTNSSVSPTSNLFINGAVSNSGTQIATFNVDAFGDGTLTVTKSGAQYVITDWHVVK
ncbi:MAG: hypothetical protein M3Y21_01100 [Candidatus Eremiobacteraeota bacterium]|nr:hypothetical protein [Candidatus Eremiobacteraeota bacterium]